MMSVSSSGPGACNGVSRVSDLMSPNPVSVTEDVLVQTVLDLMALHHIRHVLVVDRDRRLVGLVTRGDLTHPSLGQERSEEPAFHGVPVGHVMKRQVASVLASCCTGEAARYMFRTKRGCLPVLDSERRPVGILTEADFLREFMRAGPGCSCTVHEDDWPRPARLPG
jgi:CBS domain-containing membrane protein